MMQTKLHKKKLQKQTTEIKKMRNFLNFKLNKLECNH